MAGPTDATAHSQRRDDGPRISLHELFSDKNPDLEAAQLVLYAGAQINELDSQDNTPLFYAVAGGANNESVSWLLARGANPCLGGRSRTPLHNAAEYRSAELISMLATKGDPDFSDGHFNNNPPLIFAIRRRFGRAEAIEALLKAGASPLSCETAYMSPLAAAVEQDVTEHAQILPLIIAAVKSRATKAIFLSEVNKTLATCIRRYDRATFQTLLINGADPNARMTGGREAGFTRPLVLACSKNDISSDEIDFFLDSGADPSLTDCDGNSALHIAAEHGEAAAVETLLRSGVAVDVRNNAGKTALHLACGGACRYPSSRNRISQELSNPAGTVTWQGKLTRLQALNHRDSLGWSWGLLDLMRSDERRIGYLKTVQLLLSRNASVRARDQGGASPLHFACRGGDPTILIRLVETCPTPEVFRDDHSKTPLHWAAENDAAELVKTILRPETFSLSNSDQQALQKLTIQSLLGMGRSMICSRDNRGRTALHTAAAAGHNDVVEVLLELSGINIEAVDCDGRTAEQLAEMNDHFKCSARIRDFARVAAGIGAAKRARIAYLAISLLVVMLMTGIGSCGFQVWNRSVTDV